MSTFSTYIISKFYTHDKGRPGFERLIRALHVERHGIEKTISFFVEREAIWLWYTLSSATTRLDKMVCVLLLSNYKRDLCLYAWFSVLFFIEYLQISKRFNELLSVLTTHHMVSQILYIKIIVAEAFKWGTVCFLYMLCKTVQYLNLKDNQEKFVKFCMSGTVEWKDWREGHVISMGHGTND